MRCWIFRMIVSLNVGFYKRAEDDLGKINDWRSRLQKRLIALIKTERNAMLKMTLLLIFSVALYNCNTNPPSPKYFTNKKWKLGDTLYYNIKSVETTINGKKRAQTKSFYQIELEIPEWGKGRILSCHLRKKCDNPESPITKHGRLVADTSGFREYLKIDYLVNENGQYQGIQNWDVVLKFEDSLWNDQIRPYKNAGSSTQAYLDSVKKKMFIKSIIEGTITRDISPLLSIYGHIFSEKTIQSKATKNGLNNTPTSVYIKTLQLLNDKMHTIVKITAEFDPDQMKNQNNKGNPLFDEDDESSTILLRDTTIIDFNKQTDWPGRVDYCRTFSHGDEGKQFWISLKQIMR
jgi:hypothetical protein